MPERWFYRSNEEWTSFAERLKRIACPHCHTTGTLIRHGSLSGFDESHPPRKTLRARRVFCSNRHHRPGCGRTVSVWLADKIRRVSLTTRTLGKFLQRAVAGTIAEAINQTDCQRSDRTFRRLWKRFALAQSRIRTALAARCPPPLDRPPDPGPRPLAAQVLAHLHNAFPSTDCPIAAFQQATGHFFL